MAYDPKEIYRKLLKFVSAAPVNSVESGNREWLQDPQGRTWSADPWAYSDIARRQNRNTSDVWLNDQGGQRFQPGEIPAWMSQKLDTFKGMYDAGQLDPSEVKGLYDHWMRGIGIDPVWANAFQNRPAWINDYLAKIFGGMGYQGAPPNAE